MKYLATFCTIVALCSAQLAFADNDKDKGKKAPPGLEKKGGVPPGQAKKKGQGEDAAPAPAASPAPASTPTSVAAPAPAVPSPTATAVTATPAKPVPLAQQKTTLENHARAINQAVKANPSAHKTALQHIAKQTGVPLEHLKEQDKNFPAASDTGLLLGNIIARKADVKFSDVLQARQKGKQWDEIAKAHKVDFGILVQESAQLARALRGN